MDSHDKSVKDTVVKNISIESTICISLHMEGLKQLVRFQQQPPGERPLPVGVTLLKSATQHLHDFILALQRTKQI